VVNVGRNARPNASAYTSIFGLPKLYGTEPLGPRWVILRFTSSNALPQENDRIAVLEKQLSALEARVDALERPSLSDFVSTTKSKSMNSSPQAFTDDSLEDFPPKQQRLETMLKYRFADPSYAKAALSGNPFVHDGMVLSQCRRQLAFIGDAVFRLLWGASNLMVEKPSKTVTSTISLAMPSITIVQNLALWNFK